ncbi:hypothetical protein [Streptomyces sp. NBC_00878]|uniref:hypothetical protein n=1 Tax=Streptomyces sp. NBC_00878 TaxID=2975854 RepID=UPI00225746A9|nr:hypothetical protein [Streptomyces sp. NBC_00878]MCX4911820.1 hypothetical protein [Streptomyces sp. NBC_00878]
MSGETAAIGLGFLAAGPVGAIVGGATLPVLVAASMWRARRREHDENANGDANGTGGNDCSGSGRDRSGSGSGSGGRGNGNGGGGGRHHSPNGSGGAGGNRHKTPKGPGAGGGSGLGGGKARKPKVKDPVADKLGKFGKGLADKFKKRDPKDPKNKTDKPGKPGKDTAGGATKDPKAPNGSKTPKARKDHSRDYPDDRRWRGRGHKDKPQKPEKTKKNKPRKGGNDSASTTAPDGLDPKGPKGGKDPVEDRIQVVKARRERVRRRRAIEVARRAEKDAARDGTVGDPHAVKLQVIREENTKVDLELHREGQLLALAAGTEQRRSTPVTYPVATTQPAGTRTAGAAVARQIDVRASVAYRLLVAMAEQLANGLHNDQDADMADHVVELVGIPALCRNLSIAVREAAAALQKTAPLHPSVVKHLNNAAVAALTAARMADTIIVVFVQAHREDIYRVMEPRIGEDRWNIRNASGTLDAAKLRAAILSSGQQRLALPAGSSPSGGTGGGSGKLVPASDGSTKKLISLMKGFDRGHMVVCLSEVAGSARGVELVADSITKLYRRMAKTWPTEDVVDDTVRATASKVKTVAAELRKAIKAAQRAHARELKLNARPRKGPQAEKKWDVVRGRRG